MPGKYGKSPYCHRIPLLRILSQSESCFGNNKTCYLVRNIFFNDFLCLLFAVFILVELGPSFIISRIFEVVVEFS